jgi:hypothetical protein
MKNQIQKRHDTNKIIPSLLGYGAPSYYLEINGYKMTDMIVEIRRAFKMELVKSVDIGDITVDILCSFLEYLDVASWFSLAAQAVLPKYIKNVNVFEYGVLDIKNNEIIVHTDFSSTAFTAKVVASIKGETLRFLQGHKYVDLNSCIENYIRLSDIDVKFVDMNY